MKRVENLLPEIAHMENLRLAFWKAARGKSASPEVTAYRARLDENLHALRAALLAGSVAVGDYHFFKIHDPKERQICAAAFRERVLHHALVNVCEPVFDRRLIADTFACRVGKGRIKALERAQVFARREPWYLKMDVRKYFDSIDHEAMRGLLGRMLKDGAVLDVFSRIIGSYSAGPGRGLPIGNLTSQHFANLYLGELDHFIKGTLRVRGYVRYMDDFILWGEGREVLKEQRARVADFLRERLRLEVKPEQINRVELGMPFLGCRLHPRRLLLDARGRRRFVAKMRRLEWEHANGELAELELQQRATALAAYTDTAGAAAFRRGVLARRDFGAAALDSASGSNRVNRGGSWNNNANNTRVANRNNNTPGNSNNNVGFRAVRSSGRSPQWGHDSDPAVVPPVPGTAKKESPPGASSASRSRVENSGRALWPHEQPQDSALMPCVSAVQHSRFIR